MIKNKKFYNVFCILFAPFLVAFCILYSPLKISIALLSVIIFATIIIGAMKNGFDYYNNHFLPVFIFLILILFIISSNIIQITKNSFIDELLLIPFIVCAAISTMPHPFQFFNKIENKLIWFFLFIFLMAGLISTIINQVPINIAIQGVLLILKPIIIFFIFLLFTFTRNSENHIYRYLRFFFTSLCVVSLLWTLFFEVVLSYNPALSSDILPSDRYFGLEAFRSFYTHPGSYSAIMIVVSNYFFSLLLYEKNFKNLSFLTLSVLGLFSTFRTKVILILPITGFIIWLLFTQHESNKSNIKRMSIKKIILIGTGLVVSLFVIWAGLSVTKDKLIKYATSENVRKSIFLTSFEISKKNAGFGAGFGRYGSAISTRYYSPEYYKYGFNKMYGASGNNMNHITDQWWGWYIGESGMIGMSCFLIALFLIIKELINIAKLNHSKCQNITIIAYTAIGGLVYGVGSGFASGGLSGPPASYLVMGLPAMAISINFSSSMKNAKTELILSKKAGI